MPSMSRIAAEALPVSSGATQGRLPADGTLGIRPEALRVARAQVATDAAAQRQVMGRVDLIEALGADTLIHVSVGGAQLIARQAERTPLAVGDAVSSATDRSEEHTSELQSPDHLVCRLLLEKKNKPSLAQPPHRR